MNSQRIGYKTGPRHPHRRQSDRDQASGPGGRGRSRITEDREAPCVSSAKRKSSSSPATARAGRIRRRPGCGIQRESAIPGITCSSGSGLIEISPVKGRSYASISKIDAATPVAKTPIVIIEASRSSL